MNGYFITATDTGVGKTELAVRLAAGLVEAGQRVTVFKPAVTGTDEPGPTDTERLAATGARVVVPREYGPRVPPHMAAELAGERLDLDALADLAAEEAAAADVLIVEGVGGLLTPLNEHHTVRELAVALGLPVIIAARPGLGTINHTLLTLEAARVAGLEVEAVVLTPWPAEPTPLEERNRATIAELGQVEVRVLDQSEPAS